MKKWSWEGLRYYRLLLRGALPRWRPLRQGFHEGHTERPNGPGRRDLSLGKFRRVVEIQLASNPGGSANWAEPIARDFQLIIYGHDICGLQMAMNETVAGDIG